MLVRGLYLMLLVNVLQKIRNKAATFDAIKDAAQTKHYDWKLQKFTDNLLI